MENTLRYIRLRHILLTAALMTGVALGHEREAEGAQITEQTQAGETERRPEAPELTDMGGRIAVEWDEYDYLPHDEGAAGIDSVRYWVYVNSMLAREKTDPVGAGDCSLDVEIDPALPYSAYRICVEGEAGGKRRRSEEGVICAGKPLELNLHVDTGAADADLMTVVNADGRDGTWSYHAAKRERDRCFTSGTHEYTPCDDWLISPPLHFEETAGDYTVALQGALTTLKCPEEYFEVWLGTAPEPAAMTRKLIGRTSPQGELFEGFVKQFAISDAGVYYVGIHCVSEPGQAGLRVRHLHVRRPEGPVMTVADREAGSVAGGRGCIMVDGYVGEDIYITGLDGLTVAGRSITETPQAIMVAPGRYMVRIGGKDYKISVR